MGSERLTFCTTLIGFGCVLVLSPLFSHVYMVNKRADRAWGDSSGEAIFMMAGFGAFVVGAVLVLLGLKWARQVLFQGRNLASGEGAAGQSFSATQSYPS